MKKIFTLLAACFFTLSVSAQTLKEGVHHEVISETATQKPEVREFFSYYCPHCLKFEPLAKRLSEKAKNTNIQY